MKSGDEMSDMDSEKESPLEQTLEKMLKGMEERLVAGFRGDLSALRSELLAMEQRFGAQQDELKSGFQKFQRELDLISVDAAIGRQGALQASKTGPYRENPRRPQDPPETDVAGGGHSSYPWKRAPVIPRVG